MKLLDRITLLLATGCITPCLMAALTVDIVTPASGNGPTWDCSKVEGTTAGERNGGSSTVTGMLWKKVGGVWKHNSPLGPLWVTATSVPVGSTDGTWDTTPDTTQGTANTFTAAGQYRVVVEVMDSVNFNSDTDTNFWTIP